MQSWPVVGVPARNRKGLPWPQETGHYAPLGLNVLAHSCSSTSASQMSLGPEAETKCGRSVTSGGGSDVSAKSLSVRNLRLQVTDK